MIIVTSEYIFLYPKLNEKNDIKNNTIVEHIKKYGDNHFRKIEFKDNIKFSDKINNKTENFMTNRGIKETILASHGKYEFIKEKQIENFN